VKLPRDLSGCELARVLQVLGYRVTRQSGSHIRLTTTECGEHHVTVPDHASLRVGTLSGILMDVANHFGLTREDLAKRLFGS
jgi:predicted RNA binding protein YcfA (HicA-like mRNA interferase family)